MAKLKVCYPLSLIPLAAVVVAAFRIFNHRPRHRLPSHEGLDDPAVAAAYGRIATWPQMRLLRWLVLRRLMAMLPGEKVADIGCGPGHLVIELARMAPDLHITGVDLAEEMVAAAREGVQQAGLSERVHFRTGDAAHLPLEDGSMDLMVSTLSLHHWSDPQSVLNEFLRVLRPGGSFLIFDLRRDMSALAYLLLWFATRFIVPFDLRQVNEPLGSRHAAYTVQEAAQLAAGSWSAGWRVVPGPLWFFIEGMKE